MTEEQRIAALLLGTSFTALVAVPASLRRRRQQRDEAVLAQLVAQGPGVPPSLHPVIDPDVCLGSLACLKACPEGDILGLIDGAARLVHAENCLGHGRCAAACPVDAITLVSGGAVRGVDLPEVDGRFQSGRAGVHVIGELAGMGRIASALEQGAQCASALAGALGPTRRRPGDPAADVVVVGAGPAGLACALGLAARGRRVRLLEGGAFGASVLAHPRRGLVLGGPLTLPGVEPLRRPLVSKEELLAWFGEALSRAGLLVEDGVAATGLSGREGDFRVDTPAGEVRARAVVLAIGRRAAPRPFLVPGGDLPKVTSSLLPLQRYEGAPVLVVGGGDAAVEAACALAEVPGAVVTLAVRGAALTRCTDANRSQLGALARKGRVEVALSTEVLRVDAACVALRTGALPRTIPNAHVLACLGGTPAAERLASFGVPLRRPEDNESPPLASPHRQRHAARRGSPWLALAAGAGVSALGALGWSALQGGALPRPAGAVGLGVGVVATGVMLTNFLYALRKRWGVLAGLGELRRWLDFHVLVGLLSPLFIVFHSALRTNNDLARFTYGALGVVVVTGLIGRYVYALVPQGRETALADLQGQRVRHQARLRQLCAGHPRLGRLLDEASAASARRPFLVQFLGAGPRALLLRLRLELALIGLPRAEACEIRERLPRLDWLRQQASVADGIRWLMGGWRTLHASLAILLVVALTAHVALAAYLGYLPRPESLVALLRGEGS